MGEEILHPRCLFWGLRSQSQCRKETDMKMKFTATKKPTKSNPVTQRRMKLVTNIERQLQSFTDDEVKVNKWWWMEEDGCYYFEVRYGKKPIELQKGMYSVQCLDESELVTNLATIQRMVKQGDFDSQLETMSKSIRSNFSKK